MSKKFLFYFFSILAFFLLLYIFLRQGSLLEVGKVNVVNAHDFNKSDSIFSQIISNYSHSIALLLLQLIAILITARLFGWLMTKIKQPTVIGEIIAGIILGPSLLGWLFPSLHHSLFPVASLANLHILSQFGLVLFMFIIGMELDLGFLKNKAPTALVISHVSIIFPFILGVMLAFFLYSDYAPANVSFTAFALFIGIAMSVTAFPVLARIVQERDMSKTPIGSMIITCAAADDITAWCILALVIAIVNATGIAAAILAIALSVVYIIFMLYIVRPIINKVSNRYFARESFKKPMVALIFGILLMSAYLTELIGIHALFGAFMAGVIIPQNKEFKHTLTEKIEDLSLVVLLPLFFVITGLRTQIGLLNDINLWLVCLLVVVTAVVGKFFGSTIPAKVSGESWKDSLIIGILMNTRGLMGFVILNIGYDLGILSAEIFAMMVIMALITTFMTGPSLDLVEYYYNRKTDFLKNIVKQDLSYIKILLSFGPPAAGKRLLDLLDQLGLSNEPYAKVTAMHLTPSADVSVQEARRNEEESFGPILSLAKERKLEIDTLYKTTNNVNAEIVKTANKEQYKLLMVGSSRPFFNDSQTGGRLKDFFHGVACPVAVFVDFGFTKLSKLTLILNNEQNIFMLEYFIPYIKSKIGRVNLIDLSDKFSTNHEIVEIIENNPSVGLISAIPSETKDAFNKSDELFVVSLDFWNQIKKNPEFMFLKNNSVLIFRN